MSADTFTIRPANQSDALILFHWRNDPITVANSLNRFPVSWSGHIKWLHSRVKDNPPTLFICHKNGIPVGTVRVDDDKVSYTVSPDHRGEGIATKMLKAVKATHGCLVAEIYRDNQASIRAAQNAGMTIKVLER